MTRLSTAQIAFAVATLSVALVATGAGVVAGVGWMADSVTSRIDSVDGRLTHLERDVSAIRSDNSRIDERLEQLVSYLAGQGRRPQPAFNPEQPAVGPLLQVEWWGNPVPPEVH